MAQSKTMLCNLLSETDSTRGQIFSAGQGTKRFVRMMELAGDIALLTLFCLS